MAIGEHGEEITISMEDAMEKVRTTRNMMLEVYVDFYQSKPLLYNGLTEKELTYIVEKINQFLKIGE